MENPSIMSHVSLGTNDFAKARTFYTAVLATIGASIVMEHGDAVAFGKKFPEFWVQAPFDGRQSARRCAGDSYPPPAAWSCQQPSGRLVDGTAVAMY